MLYVGQLQGQQKRQFAVDDFCTQLYSNLNNAPFDSKAKELPPDFAQRIEDFYKYWIEQYCWVLFLWI